MAEMKPATMMTDVAQVAAAIDAEIAALSARTTPNMRAIRRKYSRTLKAASPDFMLRLATKLCASDGYRWFAYELVQNHKAAFESVDAVALERLGHGINSWWTVDAFARSLAGPAWLNEQVSDELILRWAHSTDRWWRRAALVSTVALNVRSHGGKGDRRRTLRICRTLVHDADPTVAKALSWALRQLVVHDSDAVRAFLATHELVLPALVKREVQNKLGTGLKHPRSRLESGYRPTKRVFARSKRLVS
jgi:3-methyladenine DNA glycosylase AlkD